MAKAKRIEIIETIEAEGFSPSDFDTSAVNIIQMMQSLIDQYGDGVYLDYDYSSWDSQDGSFEVRRRRLENDEEYKTRIASERAARAAKKQRVEDEKEARRKLYEELKKEFGDAV